MAGHDRRPVLDGAAFGVYEDVHPRRRWPRVVAALVVFAVVLVGFLVWRALDTDAELVVPGGDGTAATVPATVDAPSVEAVRALVPEGIDTCVAPEHASPDGPPRAALICPRSRSPEAIAFVLYARLSDREAAFDEVVDGFGAAGDASDCALGHDGVHDYIGVERVGRVACHSDGEVVDFVWTSDEAPLLVRARGGGSFADHYAVWDRIVERTDARFPLPVEEALLDDLPGAAAPDCHRALSLNVDASGVAAVVCEAGDVDGVRVSSVRFDDAGAMAAWMERKRSSAPAEMVGEGDACRPSGLGRGPVTGSGPETSHPESGALSSDVGSTSYDLRGRTGEVVCYTDGDGEHSVVWTRDGSLIGSIAVADPAGGPTMRSLLEWWEEVGHRR